MKVKVARSAGFCVGVKRAVELVLRIADEHRHRKIFTHGPLIHNPQTVEMLHEKGVSVLELSADGSPIEDGNGDIVVIRSHGVTPSVRAEIARAGYKIFDATCPKVAYVHSVVKKYSQDGYAVLIIGDENHAEVLGIKGEVDGPVAVVNSPSEVASLPDWDSVAVVAQTTMDYGTFDTIISEVRRKFSDVKVKNTLCTETSYRQHEICELAREWEAFVVIGGRNSANTSRLNKLAVATKLPTFWVETADELSPDDFKNIERVAVVAGASTPHWIISQVVERLETMHRTFLPPWRWRWVKNIAYAILRGNFLAAAAAGTITASLAHRLQMTMPISRGFVAAAGLFAAQNMFEYKEWQGLALMDPNKVQFVRQTKNFLLPAAVIAIIGAVIAAAFIGTISLVVTAIVAALSMSYWKFSLFERILPASAKDAILFLEWTALVSFLAAPQKPIIMLSIAVIGGMRTLVMGLKELETDRILQRKSLTAMFGEKMSLIVGMIIAIATITLCIAYGYRSGGIFIGIIAMWCIALVVAMRVLRKGTYIETIAESVIIIAALIW